MKPIVQIISRFLTAYFLSLPILFGFHSIQHLHYEIGDHKDTALEVENSLDCPICDMCDSQSAVVTTTFSSSIKLENFSQNSAGTEDLTNVLGYFNDLRGPPSM